MNDKTDNLPWYKQFWPWFLIALPASAVVASLATVKIALHEPDGLVAGDYYKQGLAINEQLARDRNAQFLGLSASGQLDLESGKLQLTLAGKQPVSVTELTLIVLHPTRAHQDVEVTLRQVAGKKYFEGNITRLSKGNWHLQLQPDTNSWRIQGRLQIPGDGKILLHAKQMSQ